MRQKSRWEKIADSWPTLLVGLGAVILAICGVAIPVLVVIWLGKKVL